MHKRLFLIPLDSRPVCYDFPRRLALSAGLELSLPAASLLGQLKTPGNAKALQRWVKHQLVENDPVIVALDTITYGGLIPSRVGDEPIEVLQERIYRFFSTVHASMLYGFSSILRIPAYDNDEEEPAYWANYGEKLSQYSAQVHEFGKADPKLRESIPTKVLDDFASRRNRNLAMNLSYIEQLKLKKLDYLTFCQDDTGPWGLNVLEAQQLRSELAYRKLTHLAHVQTGADEVAACLLARWLSRSQKLKIYSVYGSETGKNVIARFDGLPIHAVVSQQIAACGAEETHSPDKADLWLLVHTPDIRQGDHCANIAVKTAPESTRHILNKVGQALHDGRPVTIADVAYANGADPDLIQPLFMKNQDLTKLYGYAGWNTPGNTIGSALAMGIVRLIAEKRKTFAPEIFNELLLIRLSDDWYYQAHVRAILRAEINGKPSTETRLNVEMSDGIALLKTKLHLEHKSVHCRFPCHRTFEVEIALE